MRQNGIAPDVNITTIAAGLIASLIKKQGKSLYTYPGGTIAPLFHECTELKVPIICSKAEQGAGYMAIADALLSGRPSFVAVTSGPGATNLITCIADAFYDSIPLIAFTGQVGTKDLSRPESLRQRGFQEVPTLEIVGKITKKALQPHTPQELADALVLALKLSQQGRPGPVVIDLPMDVQMTPLPSDLIDTMFQKVDNLQITRPSSSADNTTFMSDLCRTLGKASRPLILAGGGAISAHEEIKTLVRDLKIPVITSMRGIGVFPTDDKLSAGWIGHTGMPWSNWALAHADWILVLGSRLDVRQTGTLPDLLADKTIFHVDIDHHELNHVRISNVHSQHSSVLDFLSDIHQDSKLETSDISNWISAINKQKSILSLQDRGSGIGISPDKLLAFINRLTLEKQTAIVTGVGSHQQWAARYFTYSAPDKILVTSAGHGTMGFSLPVALGLQRLQPERLVISVDGDGSFQMNIQELALIRELDLPLKILVMDNNRLGIVSQFQKITFNNDPVTGDFHNPDFVKIAEGYGIKAWNLATFDQQIVKAWLEEPGPALLRAHIQHDAPVSPMLLGGQPLDSMWYAKQKNND